MGWCGVFARSYTVIEKVHWGHRDPFVPHSWAYVSLVASNCFNSSPNSCFTRWRTLELGHGFTHLPHSLSTGKMLLEEISSPVGKYFGHHAVMTFVEPKLKLVAPKSNINVVLSETHKRALVSSFIFIRPKILSHDAVTNTKK